MSNRSILIQELCIIGGAIEAARILAEAVATNQLGPAADHRAAPRAVAAVLSLAGERLDDLRRAACDESSASHALVRHGLASRSRITR